jgi:hypothetical protein
MKSTHARVLREGKTIAAMIALYCAEQHGCHERLCPECSELLEYAQARLDRCPFQENKSTCAKCTVHCYKPEMRERTRMVMRYAGPRILYHHPVLAVRHLIDGLRKPPVLKKGKG